LLVAENGTIDPRRQSNYIKDGVREPSYGICQIHCGFHSDKCGGYTKPTWEGFYDPKWQVETCYDMYKGGTKFYGLNRYKTDSEFRGRVDNLIKFYK
jgi:hypothetical protein